MFDPSKPVQTRDGRPARIVATDVKNDEYPILALIAEEDDTEYEATFTAEGAFLNDGCENARDLVNVPETTTEYVNLGGAFSRQEFAEREHEGWAVAKLVREGSKIVSAEIVVDGELA
jgi:hypothetical protein